MTKPRSVTDIKSALLRPALTSHFQVQIPFPPEIRELIGVEQDTLNLACSDASLPGSQLTTLENNNDRTGVTEKHAYRRQFDDRIDLTFYVDAKNYLSIRFFEGWISYIMNEDQNSNPFSGGNNLASRAYNYRVKYPNDYIADQGLKVIKFERDYQQQLTYEFIRSFPISISSMPISFDASSLLKLSVSMSYIRYVVIKAPKKSTTGDGFNPLGPDAPTFSNASNFDVKGLFSPEAQASFNTDQFANLSTFNKNAFNTEVLSSEDVRLVQEELNFSTSLNL
tara:strand:- start:851 stop:1693 length:843 start_codon:yes stop_codon:yes gene_type:complete